MSWEDGGVTICSGVRRRRPAVSVRSMPKARARGDGAAGSMGEVYRARFDAIGCRQWDAIAEQWGGRISKEAIAEAILVASDALVTHESQPAAELPATA